MEYPVKDIEKEFFKRTFELAERYKDFEYETTFLINCLYGIIIVANTSFYNKLNFELEKNIEGVRVIENEEVKELKNLKIRDLLVGFRNSLAHFGDRRKYDNHYGRNNIGFTSDEGKIEKIIFKNNEKKLQIEFDSTEKLFLFIKELKKIFEEKEIIKIYKGV